MFRNIARWIVITGTLTLTAVTIFPALPIVANREPAVEIPLDAAGQILDATVQIVILHPQNELQFAIQEGQIAAGLKARSRVRINAYDADLRIGTLIELDGAVSVLTHNHWRPLTPETRVRFLDASGSLLVELDASSFADLIRYEDPGTLVLEAPAELVKGGHARVGASDAIEEQHGVVMVRRVPEDPFQLEVLAAEVELLDTLAGSPVYRLRTLDGLSIVRGDSGGGVWMDGELVANNWKTRVNRTLGLESLSSFDLVERPTDRIVAAQIPAVLLEQ